jgi:hypothetical protein
MEVLYQVHVLIHKESGYHEGNLASAEDTTKSPQYLGAWNAS